MILRQPPGLLAILFSIRGTMVPRVAGRLSSIALVSTVAVIAAKYHLGIFTQIGATPLTLIGLALSIFMSFRNNASYDRWWEGRKQWGALIIAARSVARQVALLDEEDHRAILLGVCAFAGGLGARLRQGDELGAIGRWPVAVDPAVPNPTDAVMRDIGIRSQRLLAEGRLHPMQWLALEEQLVALSAVQAACERISNTPVPYAYALLLHRTAYFFCFCLPFALAGTMGWWTLLPAVLVGYTFFGLDALGDQIEDPFGTEPNDLPIDAMVRVIERDMLGALGESDLPPVLEPVDGILL